MIVLTFLTFGFSLSAVATFTSKPRCVSNFLQNQDYPTVCYAFFHPPLTFYEAESICNLNNGHLTPVFDQFTNFFITVNAHSRFPNFSDFWIGGHQNTSISVSWMWTWNYALMFYNDWQVGEPSSKNQCVAVNSKSALWSAQDCGSKKVFVCQVPAVVDVCEPEWTYFQPQNQTGMCYKYFAQANITFSNAQKVCSSFDANLVSIHSKEENTFLSKMASDATSELWYIEGVYIGLHYENYQWKWLDGTETDVELWGPNQPMDPSNNTIAVLYSDQTVDFSTDWFQKWQNFASSKLFNRFICKKASNTVSVTEKLF